MKRIVISSISSKSLRSKNYIDIFPEYYNLAKVTENNLWHNNQKVFDHVISVFEGLETVFRFDNLSKKQSTSLKKYLSEKIGGGTRKKILIVATLLHDIAKIDTYIKKSDGTSSCPGHELISAGRVKNFAERFDLDIKAESNVERIVRYHDFISEILNLMIANQDKEKYFRIFNETVNDVAIELTLLMHADLLGCDLEKGDKKGYDDRITLLEWMLQMLLKEAK